jgi:hypothetical protein
MMFDLPPCCSRRGSPRHAYVARATGCRPCLHLSVSDIADLANTVPGVRAVHDLPMAPGRGKLLNAMMWTAQRVPLLDPVRPVLTLLEFG